MNREIKFRSKGIEENDKNRWYYGSYYRTDDTTYCFEEDYIAHPDNTKHYILFDEITDWGLPNRKLRADIDINTLGQFTGFKDKNGVEIYEGDILETKNYKDEKIKGIMKYGMFNCSCCYGVYGWYIETENDYYLDIRKFQDTDVLIEVIGNIYENPELLKESEE